MHTGSIEEDAKKAIQKPYVKPKLYWGLNKIKYEEKKRNSDAS